MDATGHQRLAMAEVADGFAGLCILSKNCGRKIGKAVDFYIYKVYDSIIHIMGFYENPENEVTTCLI